MILNNRHKNYDSTIKNELQNTNIDFYLYYIDDTSGQAETAKIAAQNIISDFPELSDEPIIFHNGDTLLLNRNIAEFIDSLKKADGLIDTFYNNKANYSYVLYSNDKVLEMAEKQVISDHASTGLYGFRSPRYYLESYANTRFTGEKYISEIYSSIIKSNAVILDRFFKNQEDTIILGTPQEYQNYMQDLC